MRTTTVMPVPMMARLATRWILDGTARAATLAIREESRQRQKLAAQVLQQADYTGKPEAFHLGLRVPAPWTRVEFATHLRNHGVGVVVSDTFSVGGTPPEAVRVCLGGPTSRDQCAQMLGIIEDAIEHSPSLASRVV